MYPICHVPPSLCNDSEAKATLGGVYRFDADGDLYRYGQFKDAVTYAANQALSLANVGKTAFTNDISGGSSIGAIPAGVCQRVMTQDYFGYAKITGVVPLMKTTGADDIAVGENLFLSGDGTVDGSAATAITTTAIAVADAVDVDADNTVACHLINCL